jgi:hypothetical protein
MIAIAFLFVRLLYDCFKSPALPPKAEVHPRSCDVAEVPISDICSAANCGLSNGQEIPGLRNMEQVVQVRTGVWNFTDCLHDIVRYKIRGSWIR